MSRSNVCWRNLPVVGSTTLLLAVVPPATAQGGGAGAGQDTLRVELEPVEVLVSIMPQAAPSIGSGLPARISMIDGEEARAWHPRLLADVLATQAGVSLYDDLGSPYKLNLATRGFTVGPTVGLPPGISVFVDGIRQNEPSAQEVNFDVLPIDHIERVEFLRGNASLLGPNAIGGAVNLITRRGGGEPRGALELSAGTYGAYGGHGNVSGTLGSGWDYYAGGGYEQEEGWREATSAERFDGIATVSRVSAESGVRFQALWADSRAETAGSLPEGVLILDPTVNFTAGDFESVALLQATASGYAPLLDGRGSLTAFLRRSDAERFNVNQPPEDDVRSFADNMTLGGTGDWRRDVLFDQSVLSLRLGTDVAASWTSFQIFEEERDGPASEMTTDVDSPRLEVAGFAMADLEWGRAVLSGGARLDYIRIPFEDVLDPSADTVSTFTRVSPRAAASLDLGGGVSLFGSVGLTFRAPALLELACSDPEDACPLPFALGDDPPLDPVTATNYEVGVRRALGSGAVAVSVFLTDVNDEIFFVPSEESIVEGFFRNLGATRREGFEFEASMAVEGGLFGYANYAYTRATFQAIEEIFSIRSDDAVEGAPFSGPNVATPGDRLPLIPDHQFKFGGSYTDPNGLTIGLDARFFGEQWFRGDEANDAEPLDSHFVASARASYEWGPWEVEGLITNLFDATDPFFATFNINHGTGDLERFFTPLHGRALRFMLRRSFGGM